MWRKIEDSGLMQMPNTLALFMFLLLNSTHKDKKVGTPSGVIELKRGQYISGRIELASRLKQSEQQIRTSIQRLESLGILTVKSTNRFSVYTIENYGKYQDDQPTDNQQHNQQITSNQPAINQQTTTKQECNNSRMEEFKIKPIAKLALLTSRGIPDQLAKDWLAIRKEKRQHLTETSLAATEREAIKVGKTLEEVIVICCERGWGGFRAEFLNNNSQSAHGGGGFKTKQQIIKENNDKAWEEFLNDDSGVGDEKIIEGDVIRD